MMASVGCSILGSGTVSTRTSRLPWYVKACILGSLLLVLGGGAGLGQLAMHLGLRAVGHEAPGAALGLRLQRGGDDALLAGHQRLEAVTGYVGRVVLVVGADLGVEHVGALEELCVGRPGHQRRD